jgi:hypothetical protein
MVKINMKASHPEMQSNATVAALGNNTPMLHKLRPVPAFAPWQTSGAARPRRALAHNSQMQLACRDLGARQQRRSKALPQSMRSSKD